MTDETATPAALARDVGLALLASAAFGAAAGAGYGAPALLHGALAAPALFVGGAALALPPLYLFTALSGGGASTVDVARAAARGLAAVSWVLLGLAAPAVYLSTTMRTSLAFGLLVSAVAVVGAAGVIAVAAQVVAAERRERVRFAGFVWCVFALALGARLIGALGRSAGLIGG